MLARIALLVAALAMASPAFAADSKGRAAPKGWGLATCQQFLDAATKKDEEVVRVIISWLNGFITATNILEKDTYDVAPWQDSLFLLNVMIPYCQQTPKQPLIGVVFGLTQELIKDRIKEHEEILPLEIGKRRLAVYKSVLRDAQAVLIKGGYLKGTADGIFGPQTQAAIEGFQKAQQIPITGLPDAITMQRLLYTEKKGGEQGQPAPATTQ